jgi:hypothetical protein
MERLSNDELIIIAKKIAGFGGHLLREFLLTSKNHARICKLPTVLRALPPKYANWIDYKQLNPHQVNFFNLMIESGHVGYCIVHVDSVMYDSDPDVMEVRRVLNIASNVGVEIADYFLAMLDASAAGGENIEGAISAFTRFF